MLSPAFKFKLNASSDPIKTRFLLKSFKFPADKCLFKKSIILFSFLLIPFKITPLALSLLMMIPSPEKDLLRLIPLKSFFSLVIKFSSIR